MTRRRASAAGARLRATGALGLVLASCAASTAAPVPTAGQPTHEHAGHGVAGALQPGPAQPAATHADGDAAARFAREMDAGMQQMMRDMHAPGYSGNPDVDFLAMMIAHHQGAVDMAETELADGENPEARELAQAIIDAQEAEIAEMQELLAGL